MQLHGRFPPFVLEALPSLDTSPPDAALNLPSSPAVLQNLPLCLLFVLPPPKPRYSPSSLPWKAATPTLPFIFLKAIKNAIPSSVPKQTGQAKQDALRRTPVAWPGLFPKSHILWKQHYPCEISPPGGDTAGDKPSSIARKAVGSH